MALCFVEVHTADHKPLRAASLGSFHSHQEMCQFGPEPTLQTGVAEHSAPSSKLKVTQVLDSQYICWDTYETYSHSSYCSVHNSKVQLSIQHPVRSHTTLCHPTSFEQFISILNLSNIDCLRCEELFH